MNPAQELMDQGAAAVRERARAAVAVLWMNAGAAVFALGANAYQLGVLQRIARGEQVLAEAERSDTLVALSALVTLACILAGAVTFVRWLRASYDAAPHLGVEFLKLSPSQVSWAFFIPFINLVRPYQAVKDLYDALNPEAVPEPVLTPSAAGTESYRELAAAPLAPPTPLVAAPMGAWWAFWILSRFSGQVSGRAATGRTPSTEMLIFARQSDLLGDVLTLIAAVLAARVVMGLSSRVAERHRRLSTAARGAG